MDSPIFIILSLLLASFVFVIYPLMWINDSYWSYGKIPPCYPYTIANEQYILLGLAGLIIRKDFKNINEKHAYLKSYFFQNYGSVHYNERTTLNEILKNPIKINHIADWLNKHISKPSNKKNIVQFMINISMIDGELTGEEYSLLKYLHNLLELPIEDFESMINIHLQQQEESRTREQKVYSIKNESQKLRSLKILCLTADADEVKIKKAYRSLVKECHPDKFQNDSPLQQQLAQERFTEIQKAYEYLSNQ